MKKNYFAILIILLYQNFAEAQTVSQGTNSSNQSSGATGQRPRSRKHSDTLVVFDFQNPKYPRYKTLRPKENIEVQLHNVDQNVYEILINDTLITYPSQPPAQFDKVFAAPSLVPIPKARQEGGGPEAASMAGGKKDSLAVVKAVKLPLWKKKLLSLEPELNSLIASYEAIKINFQNSLSLGKVARELNKLIVDCYLSAEEKRSKASTFIMDLKIEGLSEETLPLGIEQQITASFEAMETGLKDLRSAAASLREKYGDILRTYDPKAKHEGFIAMQKEVDQKLTVIANIEKNAAAIQKKLIDIKEEDPGKNIAEAFTAVTRTKTTFYHNTNTGWGTDEAQIKVSIKKKINTPCAKEISSFTIPVVVEKGVKIDFSTGLVMNFGRKYFFDQSYGYDSVYRTDKQLADSVLIRENKNNNIVQPSLGVFLNVYSRVAGHFNLGGLIGASMGSDQRLNYHVGATTLFGKSDRFVLGVGFSIAKAKRLSGEYEVGQILKREDAPTTLPLEEPTRVGGFVSFTWNLNLIK